MRKLLPDVHVETIGLLAAVLDKALVNIPIEQRKIIANLIAKSYGIEAKKLKELSNYNY